MDMRVSLVNGMLELKNPILSASGTFGSGLEYQLYGDITQLGGIITNGITLYPRAGASMPRIVETAGGMLSAVGTQNDGAAHFIDAVLPSLPWQEVPVIPNLNASNIEEFSELAAFFSGQEAIAAVEINLSCCNDHRGGQRFCQNPVTAARAVNAVKRAFPAKPVIAKISPQVMDMVEISKAVEAAGADIISCMGTVQGMAVDAATRRPMLGSVIGGLSGPAIKPLALRCVWEISRAVQIPVIGVGGIGSALDVLEFILAGAHAVCIGTANFSDPETIFRIVRELPELCKNFGIEDLESYRGSLLA